MSPTRGGYSMERGKYHLRSVVLVNDLIGFTSITLGTRAIPATERLIVGSPHLDLLGHYILLFERAWKEIWIWTKKPLSSVDK